MMINHNRFTFILVSLYFLLSFIGILNHEVWLDEAHSFLIARDSISFQQLMNNIKNEGHPFIWYFVLWLLNKAGNEVFYMQLLHILISTISVFLMIYFSPFGRLKKVLFAFSYYFFYEYNIISRNYALCLLCTTIFCVLICKEKRNYIGLALVLSILANTHFIGLLLSVSFGLTTLVLMYYDKETSRIKYSAALFGGILMVSFLICFAQVWNAHLPIIETETPDIFSPKRLAAFTIILKSLYQFPQLGERSWNTNIFTENKIVGFALTLISLVVLIKSYINKPLSLLLIGISSLLICLFFYSMIMDNYTVRHWGFIFIAFYAAVWIGEGIDQDFLGQKLKKIRFVSIISHNVDNWRKGLIYSVLAVQVLATLWFFKSDISEPFSNSKNVAEYILDNKYGNELIIVSNSTTGPAISAYLKKKVYYPECSRFGSYSLWNSYPVIISKEQLIHEVSSFRSAGYKKAVLVLYDNVFDSVKMKGDVFENENLVIKYLERFDGGMVKFENFDLFLITYK